MYITMGTAVYGYICYEFLGLSEAHPACQESAVGLLFFYMLSHIVRITLQRDAVPLPTCKPAFELPLCLQVLGRLRDCVRYLHRMRQVCQEIVSRNSGSVKKMCQENVSRNSIPAQDATIHFLVLALASIDLQQNP